MRDALRVGLSVEEFWALTPQETAQVINAALWRWRCEADRDTRLAWYMAALQRSKRLRPLRDLIKPPKARKLQGAELEQRQREFDELKAIVETLHGRRRREIGGSLDPDPG